MTTRVIVEDIYADILPSQEFEFHWVQRDRHNAVSSYTEFVEISCCNMSANTHADNQASFRASCKLMYYMSC